MMNIIIFWSIVIVAVIVMLYVTKWWAEDEMKHRQWRDEWEDKMNKRALAEKDKILDEKIEHKINIILAQRNKK